MLPHSCDIMTLPSMMNRKTLISDDELVILRQVYQLCQGFRIKPCCKVQQFYLCTEGLYLSTSTEYIRHPIFYYLYITPII